MVMRSTAIGACAIAGIAAAAASALGRAPAHAIRPTYAVRPTHATPVAHALRTAHAARALDGTDDAELHLVHQHEAVLYEEGSARGALPGRMRATLTVGSRFAGSCTIYTRYGSITGRGRAAPHGTGRYQSFSGTFTITGGTGRYRHVHGATKLYGTFDRRTFAVVVQTVGRLSY
jgi:hypothetical protein